MKLRIKGNSVRLRLTKTEITNLGEQWVIEEKTEFPDGASFQYILQGKTGITNLEAECLNNTMTINIPMPFLLEWVSTDKVGFENKMDIGDGKQLFILIEKDFVCLDNTFEDQSDNFPNPNAVC